MCRTILSISLSNTLHARCRQYNFHFCLTQSITVIQRMLLDWCLYTSFLSVSDNNSYSTVQSSRLVNLFNFPGLLLTLLSPRSLLASFPAVYRDLQGLLVIHPSQCAYLRCRSLPIPRFYQVHSLPHPLLFVLVLPVSYLYNVLRCPLEQLDNFLRI